MAKAIDRIIIDTNLWISFLITKDFKYLDAGIEKGEIKILFSRESFEEFLSVVHRTKFKKYFKNEQIEELLNLFDVYGEMVSVKRLVTKCRDLKDNFLLSLAKDLQADFLLTGDDDLLSLKEFEGTKIVRISEYLRLKRN
jgi:putative PIN family toxin of toxin-antitoxin system